MSYSDSTEFSLFLKKIVTLLLIWAFLWIAYKIQYVLWMFLVSGFLAILFNPLVELGRKKRVPAWFTVIAVYIWVILILLFIIGTVLPLLINFISQGVTAFTGWIQNIQSTYNSWWVEAFHLPWFLQSFVNTSNLEDMFAILQSNAKDIQSFLTNQATNITSGTLNIGASVFNFLSAFIFVGIMTFFLVLDRKSVGSLIVNILPENIGTYLERRFVQIEEILSSWIRWQGILWLSIMTLTYIWLTILELITGVTFEQKWFLALIAGIMEFVPYIWPILSFIPAAIVWMSSGWWWDVILWVSILYIIIQQLENNVFVPLIMSKSLDLSPLFVFTMMIAGGILAGLLGMILALPLAAVIQMMVTDFIEVKKQARKNGEAVTEALAITSDIPITKQVVLSPWKTASKSSKKTLK